MGLGVVSRDEVAWAYRKLLGREPESESVVIGHMKRHKSLPAMIEFFLESPEFKRRRAAPMHPMVLPQARIDVDLTSADMARAIAKVKAEWSELGLTRPHHSVITQERFRPENIDQSLDEFWESGRKDAARVIATLKKYGFESAGRTLVEYGCGVGRVTWALAAGFAQVFAYDISANHLAIAAERLRALNISGVTLLQCADSLLSDLKPCDAFYSHIVFQHNPPPLINVLIRKALSALKSHGIAIFQVPTYCRGYRFHAPEWLEDATLRMEMHCIPQQRVFEIIAASGCVPLSVREDRHCGDPRFLSNTFVVQKARRSWTRFFKPGP